MEGDLPWIFPFASIRVYSRLLLDCGAAALRAPPDGELVARGLRARFHWCSSPEANFPLGEEVADIRSRRERNAPGGRVPPSEPDAPEVACHHRSKTRHNPLAAERPATGHDFPRHLR